VHGRHNPIFWEEEETELTRTILSDSITPGRLFQSATFRQMDLRNSLKKGTVFGISSTPNGLSMISVSAIASPLDDFMLDAAIESSDDSILTN
jgi:hypothetical protein